MNTFLRFMLTLGVLGINHYVRWKYGIAPAVLCFASQILVITWAYSMHKEVA